MGPIEFLEQGAAGDAEPPQWALFVELPQPLADRGIEFGQAVTTAMAQQAQ